jgi:hypothetical protein
VIAPTTPTLIMPRMASKSSPSTSVKSPSQYQLPIIKPLTLNISDQRVQVPAVTIPLTLSYNQHRVPAVGIVGNITLSQTPTSLIINR